MFAQGLPPMPHFSGEGTQSCEEAVLVMFNLTELEGLFDPIYSQFQLVVHLIELESMS